MPRYNATRAHLRAHGLRGKDALRLFRALCTLADYEGAVKVGLSAAGESEWNLHRVCGALRYLVDGPSERCQRLHVGRCTRED